MTLPMTDEWDVATTVDSFLGATLTIRQPRHGYRAGIDAVLLAAAARGPAGTRSRILDVGAGVGVIGLCAAARLKAAASAMAPVRILIRLAVQTPAGRRWVAVPRAVGLPKPVASRMAVVQNSIRHAV